MADKTRLQPIPVSHLTEINDTSGFYVFGYTDKDGSRQSVRFPISALYAVLGISQEIGEAIDKAPSEKTVKDALNQKVSLKTIYNVSELTNKYDYADKQVARLAVPKEYRAIGQLLVYQTVERIFIEYSITSDVSNDDVWKADSSWKAVGSGGALNISDEKKNYSFASSLEARNAVQDSDRVIGQIITYSLQDSGWVYEQFVGNDISQWTDDAFWNYFATDKHLKALSDYLTKTLAEYDEKITNVLDKAESDIESTISSINTTVDNKLTTLDSFLTEELSKFTERINTLDSNFKKAIETKADGCNITEDNKLQLTSTVEGKKVNVGDPVELPSGIINLSHMGKDKADKLFTDSAAARKTVKESDKITGQVITYKLSDGVWYFDQFTGDSIGSWESEGSWEQYALKSDLTPFLLDMDTIHVKMESLNNSIGIKADGIESEDVDESNMAIILTSNNVEVARTVIPKGGGGGTGPSAGVVMKLRSLSSSSIVVSKGEDAIIKFTWSSIDTADDANTPTGPGTVSVLIGNYPVYTSSIEQGDNEINLKDYLNDGANIVRLRVTDSDQNYRTLNYTVQVASLVLTSTFSDETLYDKEPVQFRYKVQGTGQKKIRFWLNDTEIASDSTDATNVNLVKNMSGLQAGTNSIRVVAESTVGGYNLKSNELYYEFIYTGAGINKPAIVISYNKTKVNQFELIHIPYVVYDPINENPRVELLINNVVVQTLNVNRKRQIWSYLPQEQGTFNMQVRCGDVSKTISLDVIASEYNIIEEKGNLQYKVSAIGKSNLAEDRASWEYGDYDAVFSEFTWGDDGWQLDDNGNKHLRLIGDSNISIGINPFPINILQEGMTFTVEFATLDVLNPDATIMSCMLDGIGLEIKPNLVRLKSAQSELSANLDSSTKVSVSFVVQRSNENKLMLLFIDGIMSGAMQYASTDNFSHATPVGFKAGTGDKSCITMLYTIRWYNNSLDYNQIFNNYVFDIENFDEKVSKFDFNNILNDYGDIDYDKALSYLPCLTFIGELPTAKGTKKICDIVYEDKKNPQFSFTALNAENDVQGTSSQAYPRKNYKFKFKYKVQDIPQEADVTMTESGDKIKKYAMLGTQIPANVFCLKADFAESSGTHNTGYAILVDNALKKLGLRVPPQLEDDKIRTTIFGYPCLVFQKENASSPAKFIGKYNFNDDKSSTQVFGFEEGCECWEFLNNTSDICLFKGADFESTIVNGKGETVPAWLSDLEGRYPDGHTDATNLKPLFQWVVSCIGNPTKFKKECKNHFNEKWLVFYCLTTEMFGAVDQRGKNQMLTTYGERSETGDLIWYFIYYDNDTILGINNEGSIAFSYDIEAQDQYGESSHVWNAWNSELWRLVDAAYQDEMRVLFNDLIANNAMSLQSALEVFQNKQSEKWSETVYNKDGYYKYIEPLLESGKSEYLYALQGSRSRHRIWWLTNRFYYLSSKYFTGEYKEKIAHIRVNTPSGTLVVPPRVELNITINRPMYVRALISSYNLNAGRGIAGETYTIKPPALEYNNTEIFVYGAAGIKSFGDLSPCYPGIAVSVAEATALEDLIIGNITEGYENNILETLELGENSRLKEINVANCTALRQALELGKCYSIKKIDARGSAITGVALPGKGILEELHLPATTTSVYLKNQPYLKIFEIEGCANINTVVIDNVGTIDGYELVKQCINTSGNKLSKVRLTNINAKDESSNVLQALLNMTGEDANGTPVDTAVVTGNIHISSLSQMVLSTLKDKMPDLKVAYDVLLDVIEFDDPIVKGIAVANYDANKDGEISKDEVEFKNIPAGLLTGSGAKYFDEARYWGGSGSLIDNCDTLERVSIQVGKAELNNLPSMKRIGLYGSQESLLNKPLLSYSTVKNCYSAEEFILSGRYIETNRKGAILAKQIEGTKEYYRFVLPLRGHSIVNIDEALVVDKSDFNETAYNWGRDITQLNLSKVYKFNMPILANLETLQIRGFSEYVGNSVEFTADINVLQNLVIDDQSGNSLDSLRFIGGRIRNVEIKNLTCKGTPNSELLFSSISGNAGLIGKIDFPASYQPSGIRFNRPSDQNNASPFANNAMLIFRSPNFLPCVEYNGIHTKYIGSIYVPDELVNVYKAASNWSVLASKILPISNLG